MTASERLGTSHLVYTYVFNINLRKLLSCCCINLPLIAIYNYGKLPAN